MAKTHKIAVVPGDGIGKETVPEALKVLDAASRRFGFGLEYAHYDWSCETYKKTGAMTACRRHGAAGAVEQHPAGRGRLARRAGYISLWGLLIPIRRGFDQYVNLRPCKLMPGVRRRWPNAPRPISISTVRENTEGEYSSVWRAHVRRYRARVCVAMSVFSRHGVDRILKFAFELAMTRPKKHLTSATKSKTGLRSPCHTGTNALR